MQKHNWVNEVTQYKTVCNWSLLLLHNTIGGVLRAGETQVGRLASFQCVKKYQHSMYGCMRIYIHMYVDAYRCVLVCILHHGCVYNKSLPSASNRLGIASSV